MQQLLKYVSLDQKGRTDQENDTDTSKAMTSAWLNKQSIITVHAKSCYDIYIRTTVSALLPLREKLFKVSKGV